MSCGYKDSETGKVCGVKTSINPKTNEPYEYCVRCFREMRKNRQERFIDASRKAIGKRECQWVGNYIGEGKTTFRIKCIELPIHDGWCSTHKKTIETQEPTKTKSEKSNKKQKEVDEELSQFVSNVSKDKKTGKTDKSKKLKILTDNPELSEEDNIIVESIKLKPKKIRETKQKPTVESDENKETKKSKVKKSDKIDNEELDNFNPDDIVVVKKSVKKDKKKTKV